MGIRAALLQALLACCLLLPSIKANAQAVFPEANGKALAGIKAVDARTMIDIWLEMQEDQKLMRSNVQSAIELGLRRDGLIVEDNAPNFLLCELKFAHSGGTVAYSYDVKYYDFAPAGVHRLLWRSGGMVIGGRRNVTADKVAKDCVDTFSSEWLRWNPRR